MVKTFIAALLGAAVVLGIANVGYLREASEEVAEPATINQLGWSWVAVDQTQALALCSATGTSQELAALMADQALEAGRASSKTGANRMATDVVRSAWAKRCPERVDW